MSDQAQGQPQGDNRSLLNVAVPLPKTRIRRVIKLSLYFVGVFISIFFLTGVGLYATNMSNVGGGIGLSIGLVASVVSIYIFFHKGYHIPCLRWQAYLYWFLGITGGLVVVIIPLALIPYNSSTKQAGYTIISLIFFFYGASLVWIAHRKPSLRQQIKDSVRSILQIVPEHQITTEALFMYLENKYAVPEAILNQFLGEMKDIEQIAILGTAITAYRLKQRLEVIAIPQVPKPAPQTPRPTWAQPPLITDNVTPPLLSKEVIPPPLEQHIALSPVAPPHPQPSAPTLPTPAPVPVHEAKKVIDIFFCYAHKDESLLNKLKAQLKPQQRQGLIHTWHDRDISPGAEWERKIDEQLSTAEVILLLVSPDFLASDYCYSKEMQQAIERHERGEVCAIPIILRPCDWLSTPLGKLQALPKDGKPVTTWSNRDNAYLDVALGIRKAVEKMTKKHSK